MLPTEDATWVGEELTRRFGLERWMFTLSATDANRTALRIARERHRAAARLVYAYCYHGSVDEAFAVAAPDGSTVPGRATSARRSTPRATTRAVEFNDVDGRSSARSPRATWPACWPSRP